MGKGKDSKTYYLSCGRWLNKSEFLRYFEKKIMYTIRKYSLIGRDDKIAVAFSGGKDSMVLLYVLNNLLSQRGGKVTALSVDEGIPGYRDKILKESAKFCKEQGIEPSELCRLNATETISPSEDWLAERGKSPGNIKDD